MKKRDPTDERMDRSLGVNICGNNKQEGGSIPLSRYIASNRNPSVKFTVTEMT